MYLDGTKIEAYANRYTFVWKKATEKNEAKLKVKVRKLLSSLGHECEDCEGCPLKSKCTKAMGNKRLEVSKHFVELRQKSFANITSPQGILFRMNRSIQVEGAFGVIKEDYGFRRFLLRGQKNEKIEFHLLSIGYNINKLHNKIQNNRCGQLIHEKEVA